jgi:hypothetical protein
MTTDTLRTDTPNGGFISEDAVRRMFDRRRNAAMARSARDADARTATGTGGRRGPERTGRVLRRWSVAELIARAAATSSADRGPRLLGG